MSKNTMYPQEVAAYIALIAAVGFAACRYGNYLDNKNRTDKVQESVENNDENKETTVVNEVHYDEKIVNEIKLDSTDKYSTDYSSFKPITIEEAYEQILLEENPVTYQELVDSFNAATEQYGISIKSYSEAQHLLVLDSNKTSRRHIYEVIMKDSDWFEKFNRLLNTLKVKKLVVSENVLLDCSNLDTSNLDELLLGNFNEDTLEWIREDSPILDKLTLYHSDDLHITIDLYSRNIKNIEIIGKGNYANVNLGDIDVKYEGEKVKDSTISFYNTQIDSLTKFKNIDVDKVKFEDIDFSFARSRYFSKLENIPFTINSENLSISYNPEVDDFDKTLDSIDDIDYYDYKDKKYDYSNLNNFLIERFNDQFKKYGVEINFYGQDIDNESVALTLAVIDGNTSSFKIRSDRFYDEFNKLIKNLCVNHLTIANPEVVDLSRIDIESVTDMSISNPDENVYKWIYQKKPKLKQLWLSYYEANNQQIDVCSSSIKNLYILNYVEDNVELRNVYFTYYDEKGEYSTGNLVVYNIAITENTEIRYFGKDCVFKYYGDYIKYPEKLANIADFVSYGFPIDQEHNSKVLTK